MGSEENRRILGIDIGGGSAKLGILERSGELTVLEPVPTIIGNPNGMVERLAKAAESLEIDLVGVGTAGKVSRSTGLVTANNLEWQDVPLGAMLEKRLGKPVWVDNDAQAALTAEWYSGVCKGMQTAVYITLGTGVGGAVLLNGRPWRGHDNTAFELGHMIIHGDGLLCSCGRRGCYEAYASAGALSRMVGGDSAREVMEGVAKRVPAMCEIFDRYLHELAVGMVSIIALFQPQAIVLGGGLSEAGDVLLEGIRRTIRKMPGAKPNQFAGEIYLASHQNDAGTLGAAVLARLNLQ